MAAVRKARDGVLILGGGFAGAYVARLLESGSTVVSLENYMLYTPMLPEAASGTLEPRHTVVPLRQMCRRTELLLGRARPAGARPGRARLRLQGPPGRDPATQPRAPRARARRCGVGRARSPE